jgi:hypothetical protein
VTFAGLASADNKVADHPDALVPACARHHMPLGVFDWQSEYNSVGLARDATYLPRRCAEQHKDRMPAGSPRRKEPASQGQEIRHRWVDPLRWQETGDVEWYRSTLLSRG